MLPLEVRGLMVICMKEEGVSGRLVVERRCTMSATMAMSATTTGAILAMSGQPEDGCAPVFGEVALELDGTGVVARAEPESGSDWDPAGTLADFQEPLEPAGARD